MLLCWAILVLTTTTSAQNISLRLVGGPGSFAGQVEVKYNGTWGAVCDDGFKISVGHVICRQLGYPEAIAVPCCSAFGANSSRFWLTGVECQGNETSLAECDHKPWGENRCIKLYDKASVVCKTSNTSVSYPLPIRLSYAPVSYAGCVEVKYTGVWGDVGMYRWNRKNGRVVCRQLGYPDIVTVLWRCRFILLKRYSGAVTWMDDVRCQGDESYLTNCSHDFQTLRSSVGLDAGVVCKNETQADLNIRLNVTPEPYAGRVEVQFAGKWGAIDRYNWELPDAHVVCRQLGYHAAALALRGATYIFSSNNTLKGMNVQWIENVQCQGTESRLHECPHNVSFTPGPVLEAGVICESSSLETRIRLAGGNVSNAGRLEVYIAGTWGTVRNQGWNNVTSNVACRELGYQRANSTILSAVGTFGKGEGPVWMSGLNCTGSEDSLWECPWSRIAGIYWDHDNDVGLICEGISETGTSKPSDASVTPVLAIALPVAAAVILILMFVLYFRFYRRRRTHEITRTDFVHMGEVSSSTDVGVTNPGFKDTEASIGNRSNNELEWCEIARECISLGEEIGSKLDAVTFHGKLCLENGNIRDCIVKTIRDFSPEEIVSSGIENDLLAELKIMSCLGSHANILNLFGACTAKGPIYLIFEDAEHGNLLDYLQQNQMKHDSSAQTVCTLSKVDKLRIGFDVAKGMMHIADKKCIHKDLAARNIRLGKNCVAKVANIGSSHVRERAFNDNSTEHLSRSKWIALETLENWNFSLKSDIWSFGILLWEIEAGGDVPYSKIQAKDLLQTLKSGYRMEKPAKCSDAVYDVMSKCWQTDPSGRPSFSELCMVLDTLVARETYC